MPVREPNRSLCALGAAPDCSRGPMLLRSGNAATGLLPAAASASPLAWHLSDCGVASLGLWAGTASELAAERARFVRMGKGEGVANLENNLQACHTLAGHPKANYTNKRLTHGELYNGDVLDCHQVLMLSS